MSFAAVSLQDVRRYKAAALFNLFTCWIKHNNLTYYRSMCVCVLQVRAKEAAMREAAAMFRRRQEEAERLERLERLPMLARRLR